MFTVPTAIMVVLVTLVHDGDNDATATKMMAVSSRRCPFSPMGVMKVSPNLWTAPVLPTRSAQKSLQQCSDK